MSRRRGSATALNASEVVAALAMEGIYIPIQEYVKPGRVRTRRLRSAILSAVWRFQPFTDPLKAARPSPRSDKHGRDGRTTPRTSRRSNEQDCGKWTARLNANERSEDVSTAPCASCPIRFRHLYNRFEPLGDCHVSEEGELVIAKRRQRGVCNV